MSFWDELSPAVKGYFIVAVVVLVALLGLRSCMSGGTSSEPPPRGLSH